MLTDLVLVLFIARAYRAVYCQSREQQLFQTHMTGSMHAYVVEPACLGGLLGFS